MKHKGANMEFEGQRLRDLMRAYHECISNHAEGTFNAKKLYARVAAMPAKRFWVSEMRAKLVIFDMIKRGDKLERMNLNKQAMYREICRRVLDMQQRFPTMELSRIVEKVIMQPAPSFYITPETAQIMICKARKLWKKENRLKL